MADKRIDAKEIAERIEENVPTAENEVAAGESASAEAAQSLPAEAPAAEAPAVPESPDIPASPEVPPAQEVPEPPAEPTRRDRFREGVGQRNPELDMDDDDAYYDYLDSQMAERDNYESALNNIRSSVEGSPEFAEMLSDASEQENYSPIHYLFKKVREGEVDLEELKKNPDYAEEYSKLQAESLARREEQQKMEEEGQKNFDESIALMQKVRDERGLTDEQINAAMEKAYQIFDELKVNKISEDTLNAILNSMNYEADVENARNEGKAEGLNTRVKEELRKPVARNRAGGSQPAIPERRPVPRNTDNMFGV